MTRRALAWVIGGSSAVAVVFAGWVAALPTAADLPEVGLDFVLQVGGAALTWALTGAVVATFRPRNAVGWLLLALGASQAWQVGLAAYGGCGLVADPPWPAALWVAQAGAGLFVPILFGPAVLLAYYPNGRLPARWWRWPVGGVAGGVPVLTALAMVSPGVNPDIAPGHRLPLVVSGPGPGIATAVVVSIVIASTAVIWAGTVRRLVRARDFERPQLAWLTCVVLPFTASSFLPVSVVTTVLAYLVPVAIAVGVLRYRLLGIVVVLRRGLVYGALTAMVVAVYLAAAAATGSALYRHPLPAILAATIVAVGLSPARDRLQLAVDRLVYGERRDPLRAMARLGDQVAAASELELLPAALTSVAAAVRAPGAQVVSPQGVVTARVGVPPIDGETLPLRVGGQHLGTLRVAARTARDRYRDADRRLLAALALQVAVVVRATELAEALEVERDRVVTATRVERDRLHRDLHDGLGPSLSGVGLGLHGVRDALHRGDPATALVLLERIRAEVASAVLEIRRLVDGLRPIALDELGLVGAVRRTAATLSTSVPVDVSASNLPALPPQVETAAYRIITEALTNIVRHARARHASVELTADDSTLIVNVTDDGIGIGGAPEGVGLSSMRHRAEQLQGRLTVDGPAQAGTRIRVALPTAIEVPS